MDNRSIINDYRQFANSSQPFALPTNPALSGLPNTPVGNLATNLSQNTLFNLPTQAVNTVFGQGVVDPSYDIGQMIGSKIGGLPMPSYNQLKSPQARLGYNAMGQGSSLGNVAGNAWDSLNPLLTAWALSSLTGSNNQPSSPPVTSSTPQPSRLNLLPLTAQPAKSLLDTLQKGFIDYGAKIGGPTQAVSSVANALKSGKTLGQLQMEHQQATGLGALAQLDAAQHAGDVEGMKQALKEINDAPDGSPLAAYKGHNKEIESTIQQYEGALQKFGKSGYTGLAPQERKIVNNTSINVLRRYNPHATGGDIQGTNQIAKGLPLLSNIDEAIRTQDYPLAQHLAQTALKDMRYKDYHGVIDNIMKTLPTNSVINAIQGALLPKGEKMISGTGNIVQDLINSLTQRTNQ